MLATWIRDVYGDDQRSDLREAIDGIASPLDNYGFASAGVYIFFDPTNFDVLYIGLARDLSVRFAQHNDLVTMSADGCKREQVKEWFGKRKSLGYAAFVQSCYDQVAVSRQAGTMSAEYYDEESDAFWGYDESGLEDIKANEGALIAAYSGYHGRLPLWNKIGGARHARQRAPQRLYGQLELAAGAVDSLLLARRTIRELWNEPVSMSYEEALHAGRQLAILKTFGIGVDSLIIVKSMVEQAEKRKHIDPNLLELSNCIYSSGYYMLPPPAPGSEKTPGSIAYEMRQRSQ